MSKLFTRGQTTVLRTAFIAWKLSPTGTQPCDVIYPSLRLIHRNRLGSSFTVGGMLDDGTLLGLRVHPGQPPKLTYMSMATAERFFKVSEHYIPPPGITLKQLYVGYHKSYFDMRVSQCGRETDFAAA